MSNELKKFISENRSQFDGEQPPEAAWQSIEKVIGARKPARHIPLKTFYKWSAAAAVFFIIAISCYFLLVKEKKTNSDLAKKTAPVESSTEITGIEPAFAAEAKKIYRTIESQQMKLKAIAGEQPELYSQFSEDLATLDSSYRVLQKQALQTPNREVIIKAMLQNLQLQAALLAKQLQVLNEFKNDKTDQNEKNNSSRL